MSERDDRKVYVSKIVSDRMDKTITVPVKTYKTHKLYGKRVKYSKKYKTHDENNSARLGDIVRIQETRFSPVSKYFHLVEVVEESVVI